VEHPSAILNVSPATGSPPEYSIPKRAYRQKLHSLAYVNVDQGNGGIIRDLGENGVGIQTVAPLTPGQQISLRFELLSPRLRVTANGVVAWANSGGQAGVQFTSVSARTQRFLKEWIFIQLLTVAHNTAWNSMFADTLDQTQSWGTPAQAQNRAAEMRPREDKLFLQEAKLRIAPPAMAEIIDALMIIAAMLLFWTMAWGLTGTSPGWKPAAVAGILFATLYRALFLLATTVTLGKLVAGVVPGGAEIEDADPPRFR